MSEISRFKKMLGGIGKRIYNWRETKNSMIFFSLMYETILQEYADIFNGDYEKAMDTYIELIQPMSEEVVTKMFNEVKVLGISFKSFVSKNLHDLPFVIEMAIYAFFGSWGKKVFKKAVIIPALVADYDVDTIVIEIITCPFCCNTMVTPDKLGGHKYGKLICLTIQQMLQLIQDYADNDVTVVGRETKCFLNGDPHGELRFWLYPPEKLAWMKSNKFLSSIK